MLTSRSILIGCAGLGLGLLAGYVAWGLGMFGSDDPNTAPDLHQPVHIAPSDFAFLPCPRAGDRGACLVIAAGGKRVLVGAPAGIGTPPPSSEGALGAGGIPDAILLLSLDAAQIEGIDEIRSRVWEAGQSHLPLVGGAGVEEINAGLDQTYIVPDAVAYIRGKRRRGFEKTPLAVRAAVQGDTAFDTGDLTISTLSGGAGQLAFHITYGGERVILSDCGPTPQDVMQWPKADYYLGCSDVADLYDVPSVGGWPLLEPIFIQQPRNGGQN
jgi:hypothetical protein